ncbi:MAG: hypothetical protein V5A43_04745 [Haloarculaceae archaeon]
MLTLDLNDLMFELKEGTVKHIGASNTSATAKLYDVEAVDVRTFGDERVKLALEDGEGNEVEVALFPEEAEALHAGLATVREESELFE